METTLKQEEFKKTCLYDEHVSMGAKMSPFGGFMMPIQYEGIIEEHKAVRSAAGMFDVSHMGEIFVEGADAEKFVNTVFTNDVTRMSRGRILYGMMLYPDAGTVDDLLVYRVSGENRFLLVENAANTEKDFQWLKSNSGGFDVKITDASDDYGEIALQGPDSEKYIELLGLGDCLGLQFYTFTETEYDGQEIIVSRTGYTGEDGFELYASPEVIRALWKKLASAGVKPCGLGCRDTLRFEAGLPLYGHELGESISPAEAGLGMFVKFDKEIFIGRESLLARKQSGCSRKLVGVELEGMTAVPRAGCAVLKDGRVIGEVTTGYHSISLEKNLCMALVETPYTAEGTELCIQVRKKVFPGHVCKKRFYKTNYKKQ